MIRDFFEIDRNKTYGKLYDFKSYNPVEFNIPPVRFSTHDMNDWVMEFRQKYKLSRMFLHFHNQKNFGFRIRLPAKVYSSINDIINAIPKIVVFESSFQSFKTIIEHDFESVLKSEQKRIVEELGDYRGSERQLPDNVVDFSDYLKEPLPIKTTEQFETLLKLA